MVASAVVARPFDTGTHRLACNVCAAPGMLFDLNDSYNRDVYGVCYKCTVKEHQACWLKMNAQLVRTVLTAEVWVHVFGFLVGNGAWDDNNAKHLWWRRLLASRTVAFIPVYGIPKFIPNLHAIFPEPWIYGQPRGLLNPFEMMNRARTGIELENLYRSVGRPMNVLVSFLPSVSECVRASLSHTRAV